MGSEERTLIADRGDAGGRLDVMLRRRLADVSGATRTRVQRWIHNGQVSLNGSVVRRVATRPALGDRITVLLKTRPRRKMAAEDIALDILYEDDALIIINKPAGMVVHPTFSHPDGTMVNALLWRARAWPPGGRPSLVGRLDKLTSGIVLAAKSRAIHAALQRATLSAAAKKDYLALVYGRVNSGRGRIAFRLSRDPSNRRLVNASATAGAPSLTEFERLARAPVQGARVTLLRCRLLTGRMHQIRVHLAARGWPIVGDSTYGEPRWSAVEDPALASALERFSRQALHAWRLSFSHPVTRKRLTIEAPLPADMRQLLTTLGIAWPLENP